ncbi:uncharacterized protein BKA78DRAFT_313581 [Phyllosticta capitalensis]|uniref:uncharacterized protein n=1 Tax=Phyllosticta capitalensis TaxID=121624 RepID=UPI00312CC4FB
MTVFCSPPAETTPLPLAGLSLKRLDWLRRRPLAITAHGSTGVLIDARTSAGKPRGAMVHRLPH